MGDIKCTMGTGMFIDQNTGPKPDASMAGMCLLALWIYHYHSLGNFEVEDVKYTMDTLMLIDLITVEIQGRHLF